MRSLQNAVSMAPGKEQARDNRMGDAFSQKESASILGSVCKDFDLPAKRLKEGVESLQRQEENTDANRQQAVNIAL